MKTFVILIAAGVVIAALLVWVLARYLPLD
jgi:hypothetical protein